MIENRMDGRSKKRLALTILLLLALIVPSHVIGIDRVVTWDEPWWVISGSNYYYALTHRDFGNTIYDYHPAVTTTWVVTAGMLSYFPEYRGFGQGYFDVRKPKFEEFMRQHGREALDLLRNSRLIQSGLLMALAGLAFFLLQLLVERKSAFLAVALAMSAPFFLGHARLLNHEGMLAMFALVSFLGMQVYLNKDRRLAYLLISGAAFGLAQLTKSSSIVLVPLVGLMLFLGLFKRDGQPPAIKIGNALKTFAIWLAAAGLVYALLWPGMWVAPGKMLAGVYGNAFSYAFQGARLDVTEELQPSSFNLASDWAEIVQYVRSWASSSTLLSWGGMFLALFALVSRGREGWTAPFKSTLGYLALLGVSFILLFGLAQGRNSPHYILSSYVCFDVVAGIGWGWSLAWMQTRWAASRRAIPVVLFIGILAGTQIGLGLPHAPYYFTYRNPFAERAATQGYGEGLAQAAEYLAQRPGASGSRVYVYNGMGTFSFFYPGETVVFKRAYLVEEDFVTVVNDMRKSEYLVLYPVVRESQPETQKILRVMEEVAPEKTIFINGIEYVTIYRIADIPEAVYERLR